MKRLLLLAVIIMMVSAPAFAAKNLVVNGDFSDGETGWTRWNSPWGGPFDWDPSKGYAELYTMGGSFGYYQAINVTPGYLYGINAMWMGNGSNNWCELLFFNDDGRSIYDQMDAPAEGAIISKVDGWGLNGGMPFGDNSSGTLDFAPTIGYLMNTNSVYATGNTMYVVLKTGASGGQSLCLFDDVEVVAITPEPGTVLALVAGLGGLIIRRKR